MIPDFFEGLFRTTTGFWWEINWVKDLFQLVYDILSWDVVKGGLAFSLGLGIALYAVMKIKNAFGGV